MYNFFQIQSVSKIFDKIYACHLVCILEQAFPYIVCNSHTHTDGTYFGINGKKILIAIHW